jgi:hypothetical protein
LGADIAALEWAQCAALLAEDSSKVLALSDVPFDRFGDVRLEFAPSMQIATVRPQALLCVQSASTSPLSLVTSEDGSRASVLVWRPDFRTRERVVPHDEAEALLRAQRGDRLLHVCLAFDDGTERDVTQHAARVMHRWFADALVVGASVDGEDS